MQLSRELATQPFRGTLLFAHGPTLASRATLGGARPATAPPQSTGRHGAQQQQPSHGTTQPAPTMQPPMLHVTQPAAHAGALVAPFPVMYSRLKAWADLYRTCHVPRHCFDAADLGEWVWHQRRLHRTGALEQWKVDELNRLGFQWSISKDDTQWHANVHHLRQFRLVYGLSAQPGDDGLHGAWRQLASWLQQQGELYATGRLPLLKQQVLAAVGVTLLVDSDVVERAVQLQGLNAHERRRARKRWKQQDQDQGAKLAPATQEFGFPTPRPRRRQIRHSE